MVYINKCLCFVIYAIAYMYDMANVQYNFILIAMQHSCFKFFTAFHRLLFVKFLSALASF